MSMPQQPGSATSPVPATDMLSTREGYDRWSHIYDGDSNPLILLEEPVMSRLIGDVRGLRILDVGCGTGRWTLRLAAAGARVTGMDFSNGMLERARDKGQAHDIAFIAHDLHEPFPMEDGAFDRVVCALVLDHIHALRGFFGELRRVCRPGGTIVASTLHPAMNLRGVQARFTDPDSGRKLHLHSAAHSISDYVKAILGAGLEIDALEEHAMDAATAGDHERARAYIGWPMLLAMRLRVA